MDIIEEERVPRWLKWIPVFALSVSMMSLFFAIAVLYPWHLELSDEFEKMKQACLHET
jgi:hypothetical protein